MRTSRKNDMVFKVSAPHIISLLLWSWGGGGILISTFLCAWNLYQCSLNPQELYNINFKGNWTLISSDGPKLSKQTIKGGVFIWNLYAILRLAQIKTPPPWGFSRGSTVPALIFKFLTTTPNLRSNFETWHQILKPIRILRSPPYFLLKLSQKINYYRGSSWKVPGGWGFYLG